MSTHGHRFIADFFLGTAADAVSDTKWKCRCC